jgi:hypothetical protein
LHVNEVAKKRVRSKIDTTDGSLPWGGDPFFFPAVPRFGNVIAVVILASLFVPQ